MRYGNASMICMLTVGVVYGLSGGCGNSGNSSVFQGSGGLTTGTGTNTGTATGGTLTGSTGSGIMTTGTGGTLTGGSGTGGPNSDAACANQVSDSSAIPSDIFIMLDKSGSMNCPAAENGCTNPPMMLTHPTRWEAVTTAINSFVSAPANANIGVGIQFFALGGNNGQCNIAGYANPAVAIAPLSMSAMAISNAIAANMPAGNTPTVPALTGALNYARTYTMNTPGRAASVVFVSDGLPNDNCNPQSSIPRAVTAATTAFNGMPSIKTYVVGLGDVAALDEIALAGTGGVTHYFPATTDVATQLAAALTTIAGAITCDYVIPTTGMVDPKNVNIQVSVGGGALTSVGYVGTAAMCTANGGWYYDNPAAPTRITLCPQSCDPLKATMGSKVQVLYGCPTIGPGVQ